jgi:hypothetical protein
MLTAVIAFSRLLEVLKAALQTRQMLVIIALIAFIVYFIAYLVALWRPKIPRRRRRRPDSVLQLHSMALAGLVYIIILMLVNIICPGTVLMATWSFVAVLIVDVVPLSMAFGKEQIRTRLALMLSVVILLIVGELLGIFLLWYLFCLVLLLSATILLWIVVAAEDKALSRMAS